MTELLEMGSIRIGMGSGMLFLGHIVVKKIVDNNTKRPYRGSHLMINPNPD